MIVKMTVTQYWFNNVMTALEKAKSNYTTSESYKIDALQDSLKKYSKMQSDGKIVVSIGDSNIKNIFSYLSTSITGGSLITSFADDVMRDYSKF